RKRGSACVIRGQTPTPPGAPGQWNVWGCGLREVVGGGEALVVVRIGPGDGRLGLVHAGRPGREEATLSGLGRLGRQSEMREDLPGHGALLHLRDDPSRATA